MSNQQQQKQQQPKGASNLVSDGKVIASKPGPVYGEPTLNRPETAAVYDNRSGKSTVAITVKVPILAAGLIIPGTVYARLNPKTGKMQIEPSLPKGVTARTDTERDAFRGHIMAAVGKWSDREKAYSEAWARLTDTKVKAAADGDQLVTSDEWQPPAPSKSEDGAQPNALDGAQPAAAA